MDLITTFIVMGLALFVLLTAAAYSVYLERRVASFIQQRVGPNRVGPWGLLQPLADVVKLLLKEDIVPSGGNKTMHFISPIISVTIALTTFVVIPLGATTEYTIVMANVNIGVLFILAMTSVAVYGITLAGWSSNSKYSLLGGLRSSAQMISYELSMGLSVVSVILLTNMVLADVPKDASFMGYLTLDSIVRAQHESVWFVVANPIGFFVFVTCCFAETNRTPFDLVEAEQELVGGFHTEYSSMKFATFFVAEYINVIVSSMMITTLFLGGYHGLFEDTLGVKAWGDIAYIAWTLGWFSLKVFILVFTFVWVRWTLPRFKYNQLMAIGWKSFLPVSIINLMLVAMAGYAIIAMTHK